ncbi:MAG: hypothetical protein ACOC55_05400 [Candidatus Natronoplasma sp.]
MKKSLSIIMVMFLTVSFLGCLDGPSPPGVDLPEVIIHNPEEKENESVINIRAMELVMFDEITIYINDTDSGGSEELRWTNSFGPEYTTNLSKFKMDIYVRRDETRYNFNATFELHPEEDIPEDEYKDEEVVYRITFYDGEEKYVSRDDLPVIESLNPMEEEET